MASMVSLLFTVIADIHRGDDVVGVVPSVVQYMVAPAVASLIVTICTDVYVPAAGENVGVATAPSAVIVSVPFAKAKV